MLTSLRRTAFRTLCKGQLSAVEIYMTTDLTEQKEIADILQTIDAKIEHHEARQTLLQELFRRVHHLKLDELLKGGNA